MFQDIINRVNSTLFVQGNNQEHKEEKEKKLTAEEEQHEAESTKNENKLISILEKARAVYIEKGLVGSISITSSFTIFFASVSCEIDGIAERDYKTMEHALVKADSVDPHSSTFEKMAISCVHKCIGMLERRAVAYGSKHYKTKLSLTNSLYASLPILSMMTINVACTATVASLNASAAAHAAKDLAAKHESIFGRHSSLEVPKDLSTSEIIAASTEAVRLGSDSMRDSAAGHDYNLTTDAAEAASSSEANSSST